MRNFLIGQYGSFNNEKYERDFRDGFFGIEACMFTKEEDIEQLIRESKDRGFQIGVHYPFRAGRSELRDALFLAKDADVREEAYRLVQEEVEFLRRVRPNYILFHYPKPVIMDDQTDWSKWRFANEMEYVQDSEITYEELVERTEYLFQWMTARSEEFYFIPVLEFDAIHRYIYDSDFLERLLIEYPKVKLCLDTGRLFLQEKSDPRFDVKKVIRTYAKYAYTVHLWNVRVTDTVEHGHYPALPGLDPEDGWAPIGEYMSIIFEENPQVKIMFEHRSDLVNDEQLEECYGWMDSLAKGKCGEWGEYHFLKNVFVVRSLGFRNHAFEAVYSELLNSAESAEQLDKSPPLPADLPITALSAGKQNDAWKEDQKKLLQLTNRAKQIVVEDSWHAIQIHRPDVVIDAVKEMLD